MKQQKIPQDDSKDFKQAKVQVGHKMCIKKRRVTKVQQNVIKKVSATFCQTMEVEESCAIVKRKRVPMSLGPNKHYVPHVSLSKKKTATCRQTNVRSSHTRKASRKSPQKVILALDKHVEENISSVRKSPLESSLGCSQSANQEEMRVPKNLMPNKSVLEKSRRKRGRNKGSVLPSSSNTAAQNTSHGLSPTHSEQFQTVSAQHSELNTNVMLLRSNEKASSSLRSRRKRTRKVPPETLSKVQEGVSGATVESSEDPLITCQPTQCSPSDVIDDKCHSNYSDSFIEDDTSQQETNTSLIVHVSPIKLNRRARQTSSSSHPSSSELSVIDCNEHAEETCISSSHGLTCSCSSNTKLVDETKIAKRKCGSRRKQVNSSELKSESYRHVWKSTSTYEKQSKMSFSGQYRNQEVNVRKTKSVSTTTMLLRPNKLYTSDCSERKKTDPHANVENTACIVVVGPNKRCTPVLSERKEETKSACSCKGLHTCHPQDNIPPVATQQKHSGVGGVNSTTKWISTIHVNTAVDDCANTLDASVVDRQKTTSCTETLTTGDRPSSVKSAKRLSSPSSTETKAESPCSRKSPQVPTPKCQIINGREVQVTNTPGSLRAEGNQTKSLIQNKVSVTLNKLCYESVTNRLQGDDYGCSESQAVTLSVPQRWGRERKSLRNREVAETPTSLKSDSKREVSRTRSVVFNSAGLSKAQNTAMTSSTRCQSNRNSTSAIERKPRGNARLQKTSQHSKDTNNDAAKGESSTLSKKRNAKDLSKRSQKDGRLNSLNTRVSDKLEQFIAPESRGVQIPQILQDQDNLKTTCQATSDYSPKIVMGLRPYARYRSNAGKNHLPSYNSKHWLLVQGQIDSQEDPTPLVIDVPVCLKGKRIRKRKRRRKKLGVKQKENEENPNQSVPVVQDNVSAETHSPGSLEPHGASSIEPPKLAVRTSKDFQEKTSDLTQGKKCHENEVSCQATQPGQQKGVNNVKDSFCEVDSGAGSSKASHEASSSESEAVLQTGSSTIQVPRKKGDDPNPIISPTQTLIKNSVSHELDSCLSPAITEEETQTSNCKVVAEADGTLSLIISSNGTPTPDVEVVAQSTLVQVYVPVQSRHGRSPPDIISPHHAESPDSDEETVSGSESCSTYIISPRESLNPENKAVSQTTSGAVSIKQDGSLSNIKSPLKTEVPDNVLETQDIDSKVQNDQEGFPQGIDLIRSKIHHTESSDSDEETVSGSESCSTYIISPHESLDPDNKAVTQTTSGAVSIKQDGSLSKIKSPLKTEVPDNVLETQDTDSTVQNDQEGFPQGIDLIQSRSSPASDAMQSIGVRFQKEGDVTPEEGSLYETHNPDIKKQESSSPDCDMGTETVDISDQLEQDDRPIQTLCEQESPANCNKTGSVSDDVSAIGEQDYNPSQQEKPHSDFDSGSQAVHCDVSNFTVQPVNQTHSICSQEKDSLPPKRQSPDSGSVNEPVFTEQGACSNQTYTSCQQSTVSVGSEVVTGVMSQDSPESVKQRDSDTQATSSATTSHPSTSKMIQLDVNAIESCSLTQDEVSDTGVQGLVFPLLQSESIRGREEVELQFPRSDAESKMEHIMQPCNDSVKELTFSSSPAEAKVTVEGDPDCVTVFVQPEVSSKFDSENLVPALEKSSCSPESEAQGNIQEEKTQPTPTEDVKKSLNFKQFWNIKRVPKNKGREITYFYERVNEEETDESQSVVLELKQATCSHSPDSVQSDRSETASPNDSDYGPKMRMMPQRPRPSANRFTSRGESQLHNTETSRQVMTPMNCGEATRDQLSSRDSQQISAEEFLSEEPQLMYKKDTNYGEENCIDPKSMSLDNAPLLVKENEKEASKELNDVQQAALLSNSDANRKPDGLSMQIEKRTVTKSPVTFYPSQREKRSCLSTFARPNRFTMAFQHSKGCQFEKQTSSLQFEMSVDSLQFSSEESSSSETLPPDVPADSSSSVSFLHTNSEGQELTPMSEGSVPGEVSATEIKDRTSAVELDSVMVDTPCTTSLKGNLSEHGNHIRMSKETSNVTQVRKTKIWQNPLLASMTLRKKDEHFLFSRLGFKKSKQRKSQMNEQYMAIKRELLQNPGEDCVKPEPLFRTEDQHQECLQQSNSIVPEISDPTTLQRNHMFTGTTRHKMVQTLKSSSEFPQTSRRLGKRSLKASKTLNSEDYIFPAKRIKHHQLSPTPLTGSVRTYKPGRSKYVTTVPHHLRLIPKRGRPRKVHVPATIESSAVSDATEQTWVLNHAVGTEEILREISGQDDTKARGVQSIDSSVSLLSGQGRRGRRKKMSYGRRSQSNKTPVVKEKPVLLIPPDSHVNNPRLKLGQDGCDQSLLPFEPQKKGYKGKVLNQGNEDQSCDTATSKPKKIGRPRKNILSSEEDSCNLNHYPVIPKKRGRPKKQTNSITESKERRPYTRKLLKSSVKEVLVPEETKPKRGWYRRKNAIVPSQPKKRGPKKGNFLTKKYKATVAVTKQHPLMKVIRPKVGQTQKSKAGNDQASRDTSLEGSQPKKIGRPKKVKIESKEDAANIKQLLDPHIRELFVTEEMEGERVLAQSLPKKIGRPKKSSLSVPQETLHVIQVNSNVVGETPGEANKKPRKKMGRPRKTFNTIKVTAANQNKYTVFEKNQQSQEPKPKGNTVAKILL